MESQRDERHRRSVLIIDDDPELSAGLQALLDDEGYAVTVSADTDSALTWLADVNIPSVVIFLHGWASQDWQGIMATAGILPPHAYIMFSTHFRDVPPLENVTAPFAVLPMPFDSEVLLELVAAFADQLERQAW